MIGDTLALRRMVNGLRRIAARLPSSEEAVWPGVQNDLFVAHRSIYRFAASFARGKRVLDAACGTGYGSHLLAEAGAASVLGVDLNTARLAFARRHFRHAGLRFERRDCASLGLAAGSLDLVVSSNTLEHLSRPDAFLAAIGPALGSSGEALVAVPPVVSDADLNAHQRNRFHASNLSVCAWFDLFRRAGWLTDVVLHYCRRQLDFASPLQSTAADTDFLFVPSKLSAAYEKPPITVLYHQRRGV